MMKLSLQALPISDVKLVSASRISDVRGYFAETYVRDHFAAAGLDYEFVQDNESRSNSAGTIRGLHFQAPPFAQTKLVRVLQGRILDVVVDLRCSSPSYGKHISIELNAAGWGQLFY